MPDQTDRPEKYGLDQWDQLATGMSFREAAKQTDWIRQTQTEQTDNSENSDRQHTINLDRQQTEQTGNLDRNQTEQTDNSHQTSDRQLKKLRQTTQTNNKQLRKLRHTTEDKSIVASTSLQLYPPDYQISHHSISIIPRSLRLFLARKMARQNQRGDKRSISSKGR